MFVVPLVCAISSTGIFRGPVHTCGRDPGGDILRTLVMISRFGLSFFGLENTSNGSGILGGVGGTWCEFLVSYGNLSGYVSMQAYIDVARSGRKKNVLDESNTRGIENEGLGKEHRHVKRHTTVPPC